MRSSVVISRRGGPLKDGESGSSREGVKSTDGVLDASSIDAAEEARQAKSEPHLSQSVLLGLLLRFHVLESLSHDFLAPQVNPHG